MGYSFNRYNYCYDLDVIQSWIIMPNRARNIIIILIIGLILFLYFRNKDSNCPSEPLKPSFTQQSSTYNPNVNPIPSSYSYSFTSKDYQGSDRNETFKRSIKGYREYTYWGSEHPIQEQTRHLDDCEFEMYFKDEIENKETFWGAEY
jgi:hypothetical protein